MVVWGAAEYSRRMARAISVLLALVLLGALPATAPAKRSKLKRFPSCTALADYGARFAQRENAPSGEAISPAPAPTPRGSGGETPTAAPQEDAAGGDFSTTNVQEQGVDEPDFVKTDGETVFVASQGTLYAVAARGEPRLLGSLDLGEGYGHELLLRGGRLLVIEQSGGYAVPVAMAAQEPAFAPEPYPYEPKARISEVNVSDPAAMRVVRTLTTDGTVAAGRLIGRYARLVVSSVPQPYMDAMARPARVRASAKRRGGRKWLPRAVVRNRRTGKRKRRALVSCRRVRHTTVYSGMGMLTVLTLDLGDGMAIVDSDALMSDAQTVYASKDGLFVATQRWEPYDGTGSEPPRTRTAIHGFALDGGSTAYAGSGEVPGYLLSQWAMSERGGVLRVASTDLPTWWGNGSGQESQSFVTTLGQRDGRLAQLGQVGGLGRGERIYAVRFIGDVGYVVTFRQVDPLYTVDVSDPAKPAVLGELKILGYSAYLHPAGDGLLIGIGQDASEEGRTQGAQISLFDVSDPAAPVRLHQRLIAPNASTEAEWDHHAFLYWAPAKLAVLPVTLYEPQGQPEPGPQPDAPYQYKPPWMGAIGFDIDAGDGISERGRVAHAAPEQQSWLGQVRRSLVVGDRLLTVSDLGVKASDLATLADAAWVPFPAQP